MQARGLLMIEHRLIERLVALFGDALGRIRSTGEVDPDFIDTAVDFIRVYADQVHHGKEEDILFRSLGGKKVSDNDLRLMNELIGEHEIGRGVAKGLAAANARYRNGDAAAKSDIADNFAAFVELYPRHIGKEDKVFFPASRAYISDEEDRAMVEEFREFDRKLNPERYEAVVAALEGKRRPG